jgi:protein-S-isoprenylcysteine O-methyltransferase Ste14
MFVLARAVVYATLFTGFLLVFLPARIIESSGLDAPARIGPLQVAGLALTVTGGLLAISCILTFVFIGRGTPAPFDPPRALVVRGPYRIIRNPMYVGATAALLGAALYYRSPLLAGYAALFLLAMNAFVHFSEEPALRRTFGFEYEEYCGRVGRWWPIRRKRATT